MKNSLFFFGLLLISALSPDVMAQKTYGDLYQVEADATADIDQLRVRAKAEGKHLLLQVGGNWCPWCYRFHDFVAQNAELKAIVEREYLVYHLNYSKENKNEAVLARFRFPQRFGFPVFLVLDADGKLLHTQDSALLESGDSYDAKKVSQFFQSWAPAALDPATYQEQ